MESLGEALFKCMNMYRNRIAQIIEETGEKDTFGELLSRCICTALKLEELGFGKGDIICSCLYNSKNNWVPFIASTFIGAIPATFHPDMPKLHAVELLKLVKPGIIFVEDESLQFIEECLDTANVETKIVVIGSSKKFYSFDEFLSCSAKSEVFKVAPVEGGSNTAAILFSSGTTGTPKGVYKSHLSLMKLYQKSRLRAEEKFIINPNQEENSIFLVYTTLYWITAVYDLISHVFEGTTRLVCRKFDPLRFWTIVQTYKELSMFLSPYLVHSVMERKPEALSTVENQIRLIAIGGSQVTRDKLRQFMEVFPKVPIITVYSQTELGSAVAVHRVAIEDLDQDLEKPLTVGKICEDFQNGWKIVDPETEKVLGPNEKGEIRVKSDNMMTGYYKMDSSDVFDSEGYLKTGDIGFYDEENYLYVVDRLKEMFKYRGWFIIPSIIEEVLMTHPGIQEAAVVGIRHGNDGYHPAAVVVLKEDTLNLRPEEIEEFVASKVADVQRLRGGVVIVDSPLPKTVTGKLRRKQILELVLALRP